jgi:O-antigen/teichoic acid export membrane protein
MAEPSHSDMRARVLRGLVWVGASQVGLQLTRAAVAIVVARLLTPQEYGLAALALVFSSLVLVFSDLALGAALIQRPRLSAIDRDTAFWVTLASGALFTVLGVALSGPVAALYGQPEARALLVVLSATFLVSALGATQQSLMLRDMDFRRVELLPMGGALAGGAGAVLVAALGGFSAYMLGHRMLFYLQTNADRFLIGRFLGAGALGVYAVGYNTMLVPASKLGGPLQRVMSPAFSRIQDEPERIAAAWARVTRMMAAVSVPALAGLIVVAPDFVPVVLGGQWTAAVPVVQILAWVGIVQALQTLNNDILMARDRTRTIFRFSLLLSSAHVLAFVVGLEWGVVGVAAAYAVSTTLVEPLQSVLAARALGVSPLVFFRAVGPVFQAAAGMCLAVLAVRLALVDAAPELRLAACVAAGVLVYLPLCAWRVPELAGEARELLRRRLAPAPALAA